VEIRETRRDYDSPAPKAIHVLTFHQRGEGGVAFRARHDEQRLVDGLPSDVVAWVEDYLLVVTDDGLEMLDPDEYISCKGKECPICQTGITGEK
jgi:hypothetical protein